MALNVPGDLSVVVPGSAFDGAGFRDWLESPTFPDRGRVDLCDGAVLIDMSPERMENHAWVKGEIYRVLAGLVRERALGRISVDGPRYRNERARINTQPDGLFYTFTALNEKRVTEEPLGVVGELDWVLEVISPSSVDKDSHRLLRQYAEAGVREYWIVDARAERIDFRIHTLCSAGYQLVDSDDGWSSSGVFEEQFRLERGEDARGGCHFTLSHRSVPRA